MARASTTSPAGKAGGRFGRGRKRRPKGQGRIAQIMAVFRMTRQHDPAVVWWMLLAFVGVTLIGLAVGIAVGHPIYWTILFLPLGFMAALLIMARRAERAAFAQINGQPGATAGALRQLRRGWVVEETPVAVDPRTQDMVFRAIGRPGVALVTEGPLPRVRKLAEQQSRHVRRVIGEETPVIVLHAGDGEGQTPLIKLSRVLTRRKPQLTKTQVSEISKRLKALGGVKVPLPKGIDPTRMRPDRKSMRGR